MPMLKIDKNKFILKKYKEEIIMYVYLNLRIYE